MLTRFNFSYTGLYIALQDIVELKINNTVDELLFNSIFEKIDNSDLKTWPLLRELKIKGEF